MIVIGITLVNKKGKNSYKQVVFVYSPNELPVDEKAKEESKVVDEITKPGPETPENHSDDSKTPETTTGAKDSKVESAK